MTTPLERGFLRALYDVLEFLGDVRDADPEKVWSRLLDKLAVVFQAEAGTYYTYLPDKRQLFPRYAIGPNAGDLKDTPIDIRTGLAGWVALHREPLLVEDAYADKRFLKEVDGVTGFKTRTVLAVPLLDRLDLAGVFQLLNKTGGVFVDEDLEFVQAVVRAATLAVRNARLETMVEKVNARNASILDNLSGGFVAVDLHGRVILCNPAARRILDLAQDIKLNVPAEQLLMHAPRVADVLLDTLATRRTMRRQEIAWSHKGRDRTIGYSTILIQDTKGETAGAGITFQDITR